MASGKFATFIYFMKRHSHCSCFPRLGQLTAEDAPRVIREVCKQEVRPRAMVQPPLLARNWRGRMGLSKAESIELWDSYIAAAQSN